MQSSFDVRENQGEKRNVEEGEKKTKTRLRDSRKTEEKEFSVLEKCALCTRTEGNYPLLPFLPRHSRVLNSYFSRRFERTRERVEKRMGVVKDKIPNFRGHFVYLKGSRSRLLRSRFADEKISHTIHNRPRDILTSMKNAFNNVK